jgi:nitrite reductase/ring-hydroxylating ferredoxin subunit
MKSIEYKAYIINCDVIGQRHSYVTGKTQEEATQKALKSALAQGYADAKVYGTNVEYNGGVSL